MADAQGPSLSTADGLVAAVELCAREHDAGATAAYERHDLVARFGPHALTVRYLGSGGWYLRHVARAGAFAGSWTFEPKGVWFPRKLGGTRVHHPAIGRRYQAFSTDGFAFAELFDDPAVASSLAAVPEGEHLDGRFAGGELTLTWALIRFFPTPGCDRRPVLIPRVRTLARLAVALSR